jgi:hypothetical protein
LLFGEMQLDGVTHQLPQLIQIVGLRVDAVAKSRCVIASIRFVLGHFENDFAYSFVHSSNYQSSVTSVKLKTHILGRVRNRR